jgi:hypothetical protein
MFQGTIPSPKLVKLFFLRGGGEIIYVSTRYYYTIPVRSFVPHPSLKLHPANKVADAPMRCLDLHRHTHTCVCVMS